MNEQKNISPALIIAAVFCLIGCTLFVLPKFVESDINLFFIGIFFNGIGLTTFIFGQRFRNAE